MAIDPNALFLQIDSVYDASALGMLARDVLREGIIGSGSLAVSQRGSGANMSVDVAAGACWVQGDEDAAQPTYRVVNTSTTNVGITSAHASLGRIDLVVVRVADSQFSGSDDEASIAVIAGTPASVPVAPTVPDNALVVAQVEVAAQVSEILDADITDTRAPAGLSTGLPLGDGAVVAAMIAAGAVGTSQIAAGAVTTTRLGDGAVTAAKLASPTFASIAVASGWTDGHGAGYSNLFAFRYPSGLVRLQGVAVQTGVGLTVGTVPAGYRPATAEAFPVALVDGDGDPLLSAAPLVMTSAGAMRVELPSVVGQIGVSLSGITYQAA